MHVGGPSISVAAVTLALLDTNFLQNRVTDLASYPKQPLGPRSTLQYPILLLSMCRAHAKSHVFQRILVKAAHKQMSHTANTNTVFTPMGAQLAGSLSLRLLSHRGLMTPQLIKVFGPLEAVQVSTTRGVERLERRSRLVSVATRAPILQAQLSIAFANLPDDLVTKLCDTSALFGQLLLDHSIDVDVALPQLFQTADGCFGRRTALTQAISGRPICDVVETMSHDDQLVKIAAGALLR